MRDPLAEPSDLIRSVSRALRVLEAVGRAPRGLTVKQIARRCELTVATTYHLVRTLGLRGLRDPPRGRHVRRRSGDRRPVPRAGGRRSAARPAVAEALRRAAIDTGYSHYLGRFVGGRVAITAVGRGPRSPYLEDLVPGLRRGRARDRAGQGAARHADARPALPLPQGVGHAAVHRRRRSPRRRRSRPTWPRVTGAACSIEIGQFRSGVACAAVLVAPDRDLERRVVLACALPAAEMMTSARVVRARLLTTAAAWPTLRRRRSSDACRVTRRPSERPLAGTSLVEHGSAADAAAVQPPGHRHARLGEVAVRPGATPGCRSSRR